MSKQQEIEEKIREQRTVEANKKGFIGQNGKIGVVLRVFGQPIISQSEGGVYVDTNYLNLEEDYEEEPRNSLELMRKIDIMGMDENQRPQSEEWAELPDSKNYSTNTIGWHFDGLSRGMHLEIKYDTQTTEFSVFHKGYIAYRELKGELLAYSPNEEWENWINSLYKKAKEIYRKEQEKEFENQIKQAEKQKETWWEDLKKKWGIV